MIGIYLFSDKEVRFTPREAMYLLSMFSRVNEEYLAKNIEENGGYITNFNLLSQIMPPLTLWMETEMLKKLKDDVKTSNGVVEIKNGTYLRGQVTSPVTKVLIQRICNDFGNMNASNFIDDLQNIVVKYLKMSSFSVGISDLMSNEKTKTEILKVIDEKKNTVKNIIDQSQIGIFENNSGRSNNEEFEMQINNILNQAANDAGKIGLNSLDKNNRFVQMVNAGSKGSTLNITFMISCLGQQTIDGKRVPYSFEHRTLPHFTKFNDAPNARGFIESSYINGLSPQELFFHAMAGRMGLIDTAIKTSSTGYIQRRLIKGFEDLMVFYDMTVRSSKNKIVQFIYGEDGIDSMKIEKQKFKLIDMNIETIYSHYNVPELQNTFATIATTETLERFNKQYRETQEKMKYYTDLMIANRNDIIKHIYKNKVAKNSEINCPVKRRDGPRGGVLVVLNSQAA
jgi:DNA-directed RNA polymerase II subunit RPB1